MSECLPTDDENVWALHLTIKNQLAKACMSTFKRQTLTNNYILVKKAFIIQITGKVQGVYFRASTKAVANQLGVKGIVKNRIDGSVYIEAEGDNISIDEFINFCKEGPAGAVVENINIAETTAKEYQNFEIVKK